MMASYRFALFCNHLRFLGPSICSSFFNRRRKGSACTYWWQVLRHLVSMSCFPGSMSGLQRNWGLRCKNTALEPETFKKKNRAREMSFVSIFFPCDSLISSHFYYKLYFIWLGYILHRLKCSQQPSTQSHYQPACYMPVSHFLSIYTLKSYLNKKH